MRKDGLIGKGANFRFKTGTNDTQLEARLFKLYKRSIVDVLEKHYLSKKPGHVDITGNPEVIPADGHDICNYVARYGSANHQLQAVLRLDGRLDCDRLARAVRLSVDAEPVLGCRFVENDPPYWKRLDDIDNVGFYSMHVTGDPDKEIKRFLESPLNMDKDPMVKVRLIRSGPCDSIGIKINHVCSDGAGIKEYILLLSDIYSRIGPGNESYVPKPHRRSINENDRLFSALGIDNPESVWTSQKRDKIPRWKFPWRNTRRGATGFASSRLPCSSLEQLKSYAKARGATINDLILTAFYRAMFDISKPPFGVPMEIPLTIDLRRYLPGRKTEAIRNLSGGIVTRLERKENEPFEGTLQRVMSATSEIRNGHPGVRNAVWAERVEKMGFGRIRARYRASSKAADIASQNPFYVIDKCFPSLSNIGIVSKSEIKFGENAVTDAYLIPPVVRAPGILLTASTYNDIITLTVGYYKASIRRPVMEGLLDRIKGELLSISPEVPKSKTFYGNDFNCMVDSEEH